MAKTTSSRPSSLVKIQDEWAAYQFDSAICMIGLAIENACLERENVGSEEKPDWKNKYTLSMILEEDFKLPNESSWGDGFEDVIAGLEGIKYDEIR